MKVTYVKLTEIDKIMALWLPRNLTPYGKITLFKSLMLSKITHILLSLLSPKKLYHKKMRKKVQMLLWGDKPPKFKQSILENVKELSGLQLTNAVYRVNIAHIK